MSKKQKEKEETLSYCLRDIKHEHFWYSIGVTEINGWLCQIFRCNQCKKIKREFIGDKIIYKV